MIGEIMEAILGRLNNKLSHFNRSILLLMDNAGCHPQYLKTKFSNIKICFVPPNATSQLQPLDLGIIQNFKVHYHRFLLWYVLSKIDECESASEVASEVSILVAIRWIAQAWKEVKAETICKCFRKAGILVVGMDVVSCDLSGEDPFSDIVENGDLQHVIWMMEDGKKYLCQIWGSRMRRHKLMKKQKTTAEVSPLLFPKSLHTRRQLLRWKMCRAFLKAVGMRLLQLPMLGLQLMPFHL